MILASASQAQKNAPLGTIGESFRKAPIVKVLHALQPPKDKASEEYKEQKKNYQKSRHRRYDLQRTLTTLFKGRETPKGASFNFHNCKRAPIANGENVDLIFSPANDLARYHNLQTCQKNACPHCAESKALKNKQTLEALKACHARAGGGVLMLTLTNSHHIGMDLKDHIDKQSDAVTKFNKALSKMDFWSEFGGRLGAVRAWEVTYGVNGWHPHFHFLLYMAQDLTERDDKGKPLEEQPTLDVIRNSLSEEWINACINAGLPPPSAEYGVDVQDGTHADRYVGKYGDEIINMQGGWGSSDEVTRSHLKTDKAPPKSLSDAKRGGKGLTPWQLLQLAHEGCKKSGELFIEYVYATYGRSQLYFYQGTKALYDLEAEIKAMKAEQDRLSAQQYEDKTIPEDRLFMTLPLEVWSAVVHCDRRSELLITAEFDASNGDFDHRYTTQAVINQCLEQYFDDLVKARNDAKIEIDSQLKKSKHDPPDVRLLKLTEHQKTVKKRYGLKGMAYGLELCEAMDKLQAKQAKSNLPPIPPNWVTDAPMFDEMPSMPPIVDNCNYNYGEYYR